jgi:hypothetical protein
MAQLLKRQGVEGHQNRAKGRHRQPRSAKVRPTGRRHHCYGHGMESWDEDGVRARIREMAAGDPERARFGADTHRYELGPALPEAEIRAFEEVHGIHLPAEYRSFVAEVGNGPAGPGHGLMPLTVPRPEAGEEWAVDDEWEEDRLAGRLAEPFPLAAPLPGRIGGSADELTRGTLMLADEGCGMYIRLILNGPRAGEIWRIDPDWGGFISVSPGFRIWYTEWLQRPEHASRRPDQSAALR